MKDSSPAFSGLKGRFSQPRPQAWERRRTAIAALQGPFTRGGGAEPNDPDKVEFMIGPESRACGLG